MNIILLIIIVGLIFFFINRKEQSSFGASSSTTVSGTSWPTLLLDPVNNVAPVGYGFSSSTFTVPSGWGNTVYATCYAGISNPDIVYTSSGSPGNQAYQLDTDSNTSTNSLYSSGPSSTRSEYGLFNAIMQGNKLINAFMSNNYKWNPYSVTTSPSFTVSILNIPSTTTKFPSFYNGTSISQTSFTNVFNDGTDIGLCSINQALFIPSVPNTNTAPTSVTGITVGSNGKSSASTIMGNFQKYRAQLLLGVLVANHILLNNSPSPGAPATATANFVSFTKTTATVGNLTYYSLLGDLYKNYSITSTTQPESWDSSKANWPITSGVRSGTGYNFTYNSIHAVFLYVLARDAWLGNMITNILFI